MPRYQFTTQKDCRAYFALEIAPTLPQDRAALDTAFNDWTDSLCKAGEISERAYMTWTRIGTTRGDEIEALAVDRMDCKYGAPMGRVGFGPRDPDDESRWYCRHMPLDSGGYDKGGAYWGHGERLFYVADAEFSFCCYFRAKNRADALQQAREW